jgi:hypothetical protein
MVRCLSVGQWTILTKSPVVPLDSITGKYQSWSNHGVEPDRNIWGARPPPHHHHGTVCYFTISMLHTSVPSRCLGLPVISCLDSSVQESIMHVAMFCVPNCI